MIAMTWLSTVFCSWIAVGYVVYGYQGCQGHSDILWPPNNRKSFCYVTFGTLKEVILFDFLNKLFGVVRSTYRVLLQIEIKRLVFLNLNSLLGNSQTGQAGVKEMKGTGMKVHWFLHQGNWDQMMVFVFKA